MKRWAMALASGALAVAVLPCRAQSACGSAAVGANITAAPGELTLADLLLPGACAQLQRAAARVSLGAAPRAGSVRVLAGRQIRRLLDELRDRAGSLPQDGSLQIPERISIRRAGATKSCADIAKFVAAAASPRETPGDAPPWTEDLDCAAARGIPRDSALELSRTAWNARSQRWEFALHCARPEDCIPFLVWARAQAPAGGAALAFSPRPQPASLAGTSGMRPLVKPGQTATLIWDQAGIRIVLPVTCLEAGGIGQRVRVRLQNAPRTLPAEVVGAGTVRARL